MRGIENAAAGHGVTDDFLVNDDRPTEIGNPPLRWNELFPGDVVLIPTGEVDDEGWFALPEHTPWLLEDFVAGVVPQDRLDKIADVMPLRNHELLECAGINVVTQLKGRNPCLASLQCETSASSRSPWSSPWSSLASPRHNHDQPTHPRTASRRAGISARSASPPG